MSEHGLRCWAPTYGYYIDDRVAEARRDGAPPNATHKGSTGRWWTTQEIWSAETRARLGLDPLPPRDPDPDDITTQLAGGVRASDRLRDLYGLRETVRVSETHLRLVFATGHTADVELRFTAADAAPATD